MIRAVALAILLATPATAERTPLDGVRAQVERQLPTLGLRGVDVSRLTGNQLMHIYTIMHSGRSQGERNALIRSTLRPGLLQRGLDGLLGR
jgi:hypothetical protein